VLLEQEENIEAPRIRDNDRALQRTLLFMELSGYVFV
jgi:hypothetical protein